MRKKIKIAQILLYINAGVIIAFGFMNLLTPKVLPFQLDFMGVTQDQLAPKISELLLLLYKAIGANYLAIGTVIAMLAYGPFKNNAPAIRHTLMALHVIYCAAFIFVALQFGSPTFIAPVLMLILMTTAMWITREL